MASLGCNGRRPLGRLGCRRAAGVGKAGFRQKPRSLRPGDVPLEMCSVETPQFVEPIDQPHQCLLKKRISILLAVLGGVRSEYDPIYQRELHRIWGGTRPPTASRTLANSNPILSGFTSWSSAHRRHNACMDDSNVTIRMNSMIRASLSPSLSISRVPRGSFHLRTSSTSLTDI